jgi:hypothetical protein
MPRGYRTEDGPRPEFAELYGAREHESPEYPPRTLANASWADATLWFGEGDSRGFGCTLKACRSARKPIIVINNLYAIVPRVVVTLIEREAYHILNIAGNRESSSPGIGEWVGRYMMSMLCLLIEDSMR